MLGTILIIILILALLGSVPFGPAPWAQNWGPGIGGLVGLILVVVIVLVLMGRL